MSIEKTWTHRWFGIWKETGKAYEKCPSIEEFIDPDAASRLDREAVSYYLENAQVVATTSRLDFPCAITGKVFSGSISYRTDGVWLWLDDLSHYVREHDVCIPDAMLNTMVKNSFIPPSVAEADIEKLEWPPVG
jgi:hypothetical protein